MPTLKIMTHHLKVHTALYRNFLLSIATLVQKSTDSVQVKYRGKKSELVANMSLSTVLPNRLSGHLPSNTISKRHIDIK